MDDIVERRGRKEQLCISWALFYLELSGRQSISYMLKLSSLYERFKEYRLHLLEDPKHIPSYSTFRKALKSSGLYEISPIRAARAVRLNVPGEAPAAVALHHN
jgi:hypothetical protein